MFCMCMNECGWLLTLLKSRLSCLPEPWYPPWERKSLTCSWTCSSSRCQQFSSSTLAPAVGSGAPAHKQTHTDVLQQATVFPYCHWYGIISYCKIMFLQQLIDPAIEFYSIFERVTFQIQRLAELLLSHWCCSLYSKQKQFTVNLILTCTKKTNHYLLKSSKK